MRLFTTLFILLLSAQLFAAPHASFSCDMLKGCSPLVVNMTDQSSGGTTSIRWNLGNGNSSTQNNPSATYFTPGVYTVTLVVSDGASTDSFSRRITVFKIPVVNFIADRNTACPNDSIRFTNQIILGDAPIRQWAWDFGNGVASSDTNAAYRFPAPGDYNVSMVVQDTNGCTGNATKAHFIHINTKPVAAYTVSPAVSCGVSQLLSFTNASTGTGLAYQWFFGDAVISTLAAPAHNYTYGSYFPVLKVTNADGCIDSMRRAVSIINISADFVATKTHACAGETIGFTNISPAVAETYFWDFGDGTTSDKRIPSKIYSVPGVYTVTLVVKNLICKDSLTKVAYITITPGFAVAFSGDQTKACAGPLTVHFSNTTPTPGVEFHWTFGDGTTSDSCNPTKTFANGSVFSVALNVVDTNGCSVTGFSPGMISTTKPGVKFLADTNVCPGAAVHFTNKTTNAVRYLWHFGDGDTSTQKNPVHVYARYGHYSVTLTAVDSMGCDSTLLRPNMIFVDTAKVDFVVNGKFSMCPPLVSLFRNTSPHAGLKYTWYFGDGYSDTAANPTHVYFHPGLYSVKLIGVTKQGCTDTIEYKDLIEVQGPQGHFHIDPTTGCVPVVVNFSGTVSSNVQSITCDLGNGTLFSDSLNFSFTYTDARIYHPKYILTDHIGCSVPYVLDSIITHGNPSLTLRDTSICVGGQVNVALGSDNYRWTVPGTAPCDTCGRLPHTAVPFLATDTLSQALIAPTDNVTYVISATDGNGCTTARIMNINVIPVPAISMHDTIKLCRNESVSIPVTKAEGIQWAPATYLDDPNGAEVVCTPAQSITYQVTLANSLGCTSLQVIPVQVISKLSVAVGADTTVCPGSRVQLSVHPLDIAGQNVTYSWSPALYFDRADTSDPYATMQSATETFQVIANSGECIADTQTVRVNISALPHVIAGPTVITSPDAEVNLKASSDELVSYRWIAPDSIGCATCRETAIYPTTTQTAYIEVKNEFGCSAIDSTRIQVVNCDAEAIFVPNTFTPNGDGQNDMLYARSKTINQISAFRIVNRWGAVVFETNQLHRGWDGSINGNPADEGVYVFMIQGKCENGYDVTKSGSVTLIR